MITIVETLNLIRVKLLNICALNISDVDISMAKKYDMDRLHEICIIINFCLWE